MDQTGSGCMGTGCLTVIIVLFVAGIFGDSVDDRPATADRPTQSSAPRQNLSRATLTGFWQANTGMVIMLEADGSGLVASESSTPPVAASWTFEAHARLRDRGTLCVHVAGAMFPTTCDEVRLDTARDGVIHYGRSVWVAVPEGR